MRITAKLGAAVAMLLAVGSVAEARCQMNIAVRNAEQGAIEVLNARRDATSVQSQNGTWIDLRRGGWFKEDPVIRVEPGQARSDVYRAAFGCNNARRFRIEYRCANGRQSRSVYFPSHRRYHRRPNATIVLDGLNCN